MDNLRFVSLRWLRKLKQAAGRHKDLDDLEHLPLLLNLPHWDSPKGVDLLSAERYADLIAELQQVFSRSAEFRGVLHVFDH
jgi:hypothetical protein